MTKGSFRIGFAAALVGALVCLTMAAGAGAAARTGEPAPTSCGPGLLETSSGCVKPGVAQRHVEAIVKAAMPEFGLRATIIRVDTGEESLVNAGYGNSMKGVPASPRMYFRIGSMAIPYLIDVLLQLEDEGKLSLDDKLAKYRPNFPEADEVTLRMLANVTSGYPDWVQRNLPFQKQLLENPFRQYTSNELLHWAFTMPVACPPGTCFSYAHTNFAILSQVISKVTGKSVASLIRERILGPLGLDHTQISRFPAFPGAALHSYTGERGVYEDSTFWSPSWTIGDGTVMASTMADAVHGIRDIARGELISAQANRERLAPTTAGMPPFNPQIYYGLGITVANGWQFQNPFLNGYTGAAGYLPAQDLSVGIVTTQLPQSSTSSTNFANVLLVRLTEYLSPQHVIKLPGSP